MIDPRGKGKACFADGKDAETYLREAEGAAEISGPRRFLKAKS